MMTTDVVDGGLLKAGLSMKENTDGEAGLLLPQIKEMP